MESKAHNLIATELLAMAKADQELRDKASKDKGLWDKTVDRQNTERLKAIVAAIGWPTISKVGPEASESAWLLVQHATAEPAFMKQCLTLMKGAEEGDVDPATIAYLEDRLLIMEGKPQIYGTQFLTNNGVTEPFPIEDSDRVDERRARVGLGTYAEYESRVKVRHGS